MEKTETIVVVPVRRIEVVKRLAKAPTWEEVRGVADSNDVPDDALVNVTRPNWPYGYNEPTPWSITFNWERPGNEKSP